MLVNEGLSEQRRGSRRQDLLRAGLTCYVLCASSLRAAREFFSVHHLSCGVICGYSKVLSRLSCGGSFAFLLSIDYFSCAYEKYECLNCIIRVGVRSKVLVIIRVYFVIPFEVLRNYTILG